MQLLLEEGVLYRQFEYQDGTSDRLQLIVPKSLREEVLRHLHEGPCGGHFGEDKTLHRLRERFYWPGHQKDVINWCRTCKDCAARKGPAPKRRAPLTFIKVGSPLQIVAMDFLGHLWSPKMATGTSWWLEITSRSICQPMLFRIRKLKQYDNSCRRILLPKWIPGTTSFRAGTTV